MVEEAIVKASTSLKICGKSIVECLDDMEAYTNLHDGIFYLVIIAKLSKLLASFSVIVCTKDLSFAKIMQNIYKD